MTLRESILAAKDTTIVAVEVPEWECTVHVRSLSGSERDRFDAAVIARKGKDGKVRPDGLRALLVSIAACDETGERIFADADVDALCGKSASALIRLWDAAAEINGLADDAEADAAADFTEGPNSGSGSD